MGKQQKSFKPGQGYTRQDWDDVESPELTAGEMAKAKPFAEALPALAASIRKGRGPNKAPTKKLITLRLSGSVIEKYKSGGEGWQSRIDADLKRINKIK
ncbi:MAG: BrnA antitoxin family protein [Bradyrhizobium sp.]|nr:BrnA antitoxin family protein [Bradyrhizobium sp.]